MAFKQFLIGDMPVTIYKRKNSRSLKLSITAQGKVQISIPTWTPYAAGLQFAHSRQEWIRSQLPPADSFLHNGQAIGKAHRLKLVPVMNAAAPIARVRQNLVIVYYPRHLNPADDRVQQAASKACIRALRSEAEQLLPQRLGVLAEQFSFTYSSVRIKLLKSRWGSCDHEQNIVLNLYLMQLPWECIDYVLMHELNHTRIMQHGPRFWTAMDKLLPETKRLRRIMRNYRPLLHTLSDMEAASV